ncbi:MAG: hypothetical protein AB8G18_16515 [Gammaproteobacteria bacterium]
MIGIARIGVYLPQLRLRRDAIASAHAWGVPALKAHAKGTVATSNWDEDAVTMAHEAAREIVVTSESDISGLSFCSTSMPFADRSHATLLCEALGLQTNIPVQDIAASQRAGTSTLMAALQGQRSGELVIASERRKAQPASVQEMTYGDAAVALTTGVSNLLAEFVAATSVNADFVDHYRSADSQFDYAFEPRWVRDEGQLKLIAEAIESVLAKAKCGALSVNRLVINAPTRVAAKLAKATGLDNANSASVIAQQIGLSGCASPLMALAESLETAREGQLVLCIGFGQGADAMLFRAGPAAGKPEAFSAALSKGVEDTNYLRFLSNRNLIDMDWGMRAERDVRTAQSAYYRERNQITAMVGGLCSACGTVQFPRTKSCVNPACRELGEQGEYSFAGKHGRVKSFTEDWQAYSPSPPLTYGNIEFEGGANIMMQFTDTRAGDTQIGTEVSMHFRIKDIDRHRNFRRYFWKAIAAEAL